MAAETRRFEAARFCAQVQCDALHEKYALLVASEEEHVDKELCQLRVNPKQQFNISEAIPSELMDFAGDVDLFDEMIDGVVVEQDNYDKEPVTDDSLAAQEPHFEDGSVDKIELGFKMGSLPVAVPGVAPSQTTATTSEKVDINLVPEPEFTNLTAEEKLYLIQGSFVIFCVACTNLNLSQFCVRFLSWRSLHFAIQKQVCDP